MPTTTVSIAASGDDAYVQAASSNYTTMSSTDVFGTPTTNTEDFVRKLFETPDYYAYSGLLRFDTSGIPDDATVTGAVLELRVEEVVNADSRNLQAEWYAYDGTPAAADWVKTIGTANAYDSALSGITAGGVRQLTLLNPTNVSKTGYTGLRLAISGGAPAGDNYIWYTTFDHATNPEPKLVVTYTTVGTALGATSNTTAYPGAGGYLLGTAPSTQLADGVPLGTVLNTAAFPTTGGGGDGLPSPITGEDYEIVFEDDFTSSTYGVASGPWNPDHYQDVLAGAISITGGKLIINNKRSDGFPNISACLRRDDDVVDASAPRFKFGFFEAVMKIPDSQGLTPAFWLITNNDHDGGANPPPASREWAEIDIFEYYPGNFSDWDDYNLHFTIHRNTGSNFSIPDETRTTYPQPLGPSTSIGHKWFKCGFLWPDDGTSNLRMYYAFPAENTAAAAAVAAYTEGGSLQPYPSTAQAMTLIFYIWNQVQVGFPGPGAGVADENIMEVDYLKVWQKPAAGGSVPGS